MTRLPAAVAAALLATALAATGVAQNPAPSRATDPELVHVLSRVGFGPRPGDVEKLRTMGIDRYIDQQLHPERISDTQLTARLDGFDTLELSTAELLARYEQPLQEARRRQQEAARANPDAPMQQRPMLDAGVQPNTPLLELSQQKLLRAIHSERQLEEVLTDFWFNHFNVDARKGPVRFMLIEYERDAIRPHVLGKFRDLLGATAESPAMLFYLDNWMSAAAQSQPGRQQPLRPRRQLQPLRPAQAQRPRPAQPAQPPNMRRGLNENYARELMELHTLGVDGGYTQKDVTEVARAFTGWTIENPRARGTFRFDPRLHDEGVKTVLGRRIDAGGRKDGEEVLDLLAAHPSTARFISTKLARRFVSDTPPPALVDRMAARFTATKGDLREVMRTMLTSSEFLDAAVHGAKVKSPFEFVVSAARATSAELPDTRVLVRQLQQLGMPLYQCQPPTGYKDTADAWVNTGALVNRMNFAQALAGGGFAGPLGRGRGQAPRAAARTSQAKLDVNADVLAGLALSEATRSTIERATTPQQALALKLGSPEFQRR
jgi:uncharacterized protein (DUF1800 family)